MPIDRDKALGATLGTSQGSYEADDVILYHLGVGAGFAATDEHELEYTFEKKLKVLPSFAVVAGSSFSSRVRRSGGGGMGGLGKVPGLEFNPAMLLHGEQEIAIHQPLPTAASFTTEGRIAEIFDKGKAALVIVENVSKDESGEPLFTQRMSLFLRGEGGFGGPSGPKAGNTRPERAADGVLESRTLPQQALLYRLNGDKNPLHADPEFAKMGGFDAPIIHGLCSYGIACKAIVDGALGGDTTRVSGYAARFAGVAFPGETYLTSWWQEGGRILLETKSKERDALIISNAAVTLRS
jgi:acyl dehydratase